MRKLQKMKRAEESVFSSLREEKVSSTTITKELSFLDCISISPHTSRAQGMPPLVIDPKEMELAESKFGLPGKGKGLRKLLSQSILVAYIWPCPDLFPF